MFGCRKCFGTIGHHSGNQMFFLHNQTCYLHLHLHLNLISLNPLIYHSTDIYFWQKKYWKVKSSKTPKLHNPQTEMQPRKEGIKKFPSQWSKHQNTDGINFTLNRSQRTHSSKLKNTKYWCCFYPDEIQYSSQVNILFLSAFHLNSLLSLSTPLKQHFEVSPVWHIGKILNINLTPKSFKEKEQKMKGKNKILFKDLEHF